MSNTLDAKAIAEAHEAVAKHGSISSAARALGVPQSTLRSRLKHRYTGPSAAPSIKTKFHGRSVDDFCDKFDPTRKAEHAFSTMPDWLYEDEFFSHAQLTKNNATLIAMREAFSDRIIEVRERGRAEKRIWCKTAAIAAKLKAKTQARTAS